MLTKQQLIDAWADWLAHWEWDLLGTLTFPGYPSRTKAKRIFEIWISELQKEAGADDFRYFQVMESGAYGDNNHFHILLGGLKKTARQFPLLWRDRWQELAGQAAVQRFDPKRGGIRYLLKTLLPDRDLEITMKFSEQSQPGSKE